MSRRTGIGKEHPLNDKVQFIFLVVFIVVWGLDSFIFYYSTMLSGVISIFIRVPIGIILFIIGVYLVAKSDSAVFGKTMVGRIGEPKLITTGVYAWVRHPMYLGTLLILLGLSIATLSILSLIVWGAFFIFFDRMASFEEKDLIKIIGEQYLEYRRRVSKWIPYKRGLSLEFINLENHQT